MDQMFRAVLEFQTTPQQIVDLVRPTRTPTLMIHLPAVLAVNVSGGMC